MKAIKQEKKKICVTEDKKFEIIQSENKEKHDKNEETCVIYGYSQCFNYCSSQKKSEMRAESLFKK